MLKAGFRGMGGGDENMNRLHFTQEQWKISYENGNELKSSIQGGELPD
jgi:hypothetical protein